jgi:hypothetical protein
MSGCGSCGGDSSGGASVSRQGFLPSLHYRFCPACWEEIEAALRAVGVEHIWADNPNEWWAGGNPWPP